MSQKTIDLIYGEDGFFVIALPNDIYVRLSESTNFDFREPGCKKGVLFEVSGTFECKKRIKSNKLVNLTRYQHKKVLTRIFNQAAKYAEAIEILADHLEKEVNDII